MSDPKSSPSQIEAAEKTRNQSLGPAEEEQESSQPGGVSLTLIYIILFVVLLIATGMGLLIVLPFFHRGAL